MLYLPAKTACLIKTWTELPFLFGESIMRISPLVLAFLLAMTSGVQAQDQSVEPTDVKSAPKSAPKSAAKSAQEVEPKSAVESSDADKAAVDKAAADKAAEEKRAAEEKEAAEAAESDVAKAVRAELFEQAKSYKFQSTANVHEPVDLKLIERSVLNWTNPIRHADTGIVVIWEDEGLPLAFGTLFSTGRSYRHSLTSISQFPLGATYQGKATWTPTPGVTWQEWKDEKTSIAKSKALRMVQMRSIARQFEFRLKSGDDVKRLRLMPQPLLRFKSEKHGVLDGAVMAFAEGNDAEVVFVLRADEDAKTWQYGCARCGWFAMSGHIKDKEIWKVNRVRSASTRMMTKRYMSSPYLSSDAPIADSRSVAYDDQLDISLP